MNPPASANHSYFARRSAALAWLSLCPLLAASPSAAGVFGLGLAACAVFGLGGLAATALGRWLPHEVRQAAIAVLVTGLAIAIARCLIAWLPDTEGAIGRAVPMITAGGILIVGTDTSSWTQPGQGLLARMVTAGLAGIGVLFAIGVIRAMAGHGTLPALRPAAGFLLVGLLLAAACTLRDHATAATSPRPVGSTR